LIRRKFKAFTVPVVNNQSRNFAEQKYFSKNKSCNQLKISYIKNHKSVGK
jgi:hypothetical protein